MKKEESIRNEIIKSCLKIEYLKLNQGKTGNISHRFNDGLLITPSARDYKKIKSRDLVYITKKGKFNRIQKPSIEWKFHLEIYKKIPEVNSVIHNHPIYGTGFSMLQKKIDSYHYLIALFGGIDVRCTKFYIPGSMELANAIVKSLNKRNVTLIANHGVVTTGKNLEETVYLAEQFEAMCKQITISKINGSPKKIPLKEMKKILIEIKNYNKKN
tara:strand:- start:27367 stop:28008 length:642 start_codon:yes stop_codon:yes gene_type:complete